MGVEGREGVVRPRRAPTPLAQDARKKKTTARYTNNCVGAGNLRAFLLFLVCARPRSVVIGRAAARGPLEQ